MTWTNRNDLLMNGNALSVREIELSDIDAIIGYWLNADPMFLAGMGVDVNKMPREGQWQKMLAGQVLAPIEKKQSYCLIWEQDGRPIGHCNARPIVFGKEAYMHLHLWESGIRAKGLGVGLVKMSMPWFFRNLRLQKIVCEPYALNPAPNRTLEKVGFDLVKEYITIPGFLNFEQPVKRWELSVEKMRVTQPRTVDR